LRQLKRSEFQGIPLLIQSVLFAAETGEILPLPEPIQKPSANWARLMKKVFDFDPLICPKCGSSMRIKAFISDSKEIARITKNLGIPDQRAPPKLKYLTPLAA